MFKLPPIKAYNIIDQPEKACTQIPYNGHCMLVKIILNIHQLDTSSKISIIKLYVDVDSTLF